MGKSHLENCICNAKLVILCYGDNMHVPEEDEDEWDDNTDEDMDDRVCNGGGEVWQAGSLASHVDMSEGTNIEQGGQGGHPDKDPGEEEEETHPPTG